MSSQANHPRRIVSVPSHPRSQTVSITEQGAHEAVSVLQLYRHILSAYSVRYMDKLYVDDQNFSHTTR